MKHKTTLIFAAAALAVILGVVPAYAAQKAAPAEPAGSAAQVKTGESVGEQGQASEAVAAQTQIQTQTQTQTKMSAGVCEECDEPVQLKERTRAREQERVNENENPEGAALRTRDENRVSDEAQDSDEPSQSVDPTSSVEPTPTIEPTSTVEPEAEVATENFVEAVTVGLKNWFQTMLGYFGLS